MLPASGLIPILALVCVIVHVAGNQLVEGSLTEALIYMVMVVGLSVFVSNSGIISFGHVSFALVGAYASAARRQTVSLPLDRADPVFRHGAVALEVE